MNRYRKEEHGIGSFFVATPGDVLHFPHGLPLHSKNIRRCKDCALSNMVEAFSPPVPTPNPSIQLNFKPLQITARKWYEISA